MARSDKDNVAKEHALKFCAASGMLCFLEVDVFTPLDVTTSPKKITDLDVFGISMHPDGSTSKTIFDCKSAGGPAFARALWLSGLMRFVRADDGFILMGKPAERAHRLAARKLNVNVFGSGGFDNFAAATNPEYRVLQSYAGNIEFWHRILDGVNQFKELTKIYSIIQEEVPLSNDPAKALRRLISGTLPLKGELNPLKALHLSVFSELCVAVAYLMVQIVADLRNIVDLDEDEREFSKTLRYYMWGGPEGVENLRKMKLLLGNGDQAEEGESKLLAWPNLVQLVRGLLESPTTVRNAALVLRELSIRQSADKSEGADLRLGRMLMASRARQFTKRIVSYSANVLRIPTDFIYILDKQIDDLVAEAQ